MDDSARKERVLAEIDSARNALLAQISQVNEDQWQNTVFAEGDNWTILDILRHLFNAEKSMGRLIETIKAGGEGAPADFDLARFNASRVRKSQALTTAEIKQGLVDSRAYILQVIEGLAAEDWEKKGRHGSMRILTIEEILYVIAEHDQTHTQHIAAALA